MRDDIGIYKILITISALKHNPITVLRQQVAFDSSLLTIEFVGIDLSLTSQMKRNYKVVLFD